jgi:hypothetical protein
MIVPTGPEEGVKVALAVVTVKTLLNVWIPLIAAVMMIVLVPGIAPEGTVILPDRLPLLLIDNVSAAAIPPTVTLMLLSVAVAQPDPAVTLILVPTGPDVGVKVAAAVVTVKALVYVWAKVWIPVITIFLPPVPVEGIVIVPDSTPLILTVNVLIAVFPPTVTPEIVSESAQPEPVTVILVPTGPEVGLKVTVTVVTF